MVTISDWNDLDAMRNDLTANYTLENDLDSSTAGYSGIGDDWTPLGFVGGDNQGNALTGEFNGQGYRISDLVVEENNSTAGGVAFITRITDGTTLKNLTVDGTVDSTIDDRFYGGLVAVNDVGAGAANIENCVSHIDVTAPNGSSVGGLVGMNSGRIKNSYATGSVEGSSSGTTRAGGLVGYNEFEVSNCYATGSVTGNEVVGGLIGRQTEDLQTSYAVGSVTGNVDVGALVGENEFAVETSDSYADEQTTGQTSLTGDGLGTTTNSRTLTTSEMQGGEASNSGNMDGFDYTNVWDTVLEEDSDAAADGYPILSDLDRTNQLALQGVFQAFALSVQTNAADLVSSTSATLNGEITELADGESADVFFEYGANVGDNQTTKTTLNDTVAFDDTVQSLPDAVIEFRAIAEGESDGISFTVTGDTLTFETFNKWKSLIDGTELKTF